MKFDLTQHNYDLRLAIKAGDIARVNASLKIVRIPSNSMLDTAMHAALRDLSADRLEILTTVIAAATCSQQGKIAQMRHNIVVNTSPVTMNVLIEAINAGQREPEITESTKSQYAANKNVGVQPGVGG